MTLADRRQGRVLGIDLGTRRTGVAVSDSARTLATPYATIPGDGAPEVVVDRIAALVEETGATVVVVGLPLGLDGRAGPAAAAAAAVVACARQVLQARGVPVETVDERLTTVHAHRALAAAGRRARQRRPVVDQVAASLLLQGWLDGHREAGRPTGSSGHTDAGRPARPSGRREAQ